MRCVDVMKRDVERCLESALLTEAAVAMRDRNVGLLPVTDEDATAVGTLTDRDIAIRALAQGRAPDRTRVAEVMTRAVVACHPDDELAVAEDLMARFEKARVVCVDGRRRVVGVISLSDIAERVAGDRAGTIAASVALREGVVRADVPRLEVKDVRCRDVMATRVRCASRHEVVGNLAAAMRAYNVGFLPVCNEEGAVIGAVTDRDLVVRVVAAGLPVQKTRAGDVFTRGSVCCFPDQPLRVAEELMAQHKRSRVVCVDAYRRPVGVLSLSDVMRVERARRASHVLREVCARAPSAA
jgi:CBS domain-containing protein